MTATPAIGTRSLTGIIKRPALEQRLIDVREGAAEQNGVTVRTGAGDRGGILIAAQRKYSATSKRTGILNDLLASEPCRAGRDDLRVYRDYLTPSTLETERFHHFANFACRRYSPEPELGLKS